MEAAQLNIDHRRLTYVQVVRGELVINDNRLSAGDGAALRGESRLTIGDGKSAEVLVFDLAT